MNKAKDKVVADVRKIREEVWEEYQRDPIAFNKQSEQLRKKLNLKKSNLKPIAKSLQEIKDRKNRKKSA
ncbi:MAG: hypothetical protein LC102_01120 [Ignavibacteriales bacterium]|nr:hypothetical protein [Ignavibacteriales bacterium]